MNTLRQSRLQALMSYLLLSINKTISRKQLAFLFWPKSTEKQAQANLRKLLYQLRNKLPQTNKLLTITSRDIQWNSSANIDIDVVSFEVWVDIAERSKISAEKKQILETAVALYTGDLLPAFYDDWVIHERTRLRGRLMFAMHTLAELAEKARDYQTAVLWTQQLLQIDPLQETTYRQLIKRYMLAGDRAKALSSYHLCATTLRDELGVEPSLETEALRKRILRLEAESPQKESLALTEYLPLVGRQSEWRRLEQAWQRTEKGRASLFLVQGEGGIGKTRLVEELFDTVQRQGLATIHTRAYEAGGTSAYGPIVSLFRQKPFEELLITLDPSWLTELARLLPELTQKMPDLPIPKPIKEAWQLHRFHEALTRCCLSLGQPLLIHFDDLQWCDAETLEWLRFLLEFDRKAKLLIVGTLRDDEISDSHPVLALHLDLQRRGRSQAVDLKPLSFDDVAELAGKVVGQTMSETAVSNLFSDTEGSPLFVIEMLRAGDNAIEALQQERDLIESSNSSQNIRELPPKALSVIKWRLNQLSPSARQFVGKAAVFGRSFTFEHLVKTNNDQEDEVILVLDELWRRRIVRERGADEYDFSHDRIREVAYQEISPIMRRRWHKQAAEILEESSSSTEFATAGQIAVHYEQAGHHEKAIDFYQVAAAQATATYAKKQAVIFLTKAFELTSLSEREKRFYLLNQRQARYGDLLQPDEQLTDLQLMQKVAYEINKYSPGVVEPEIIIAICFGAFYRTAAQPEKAATYLQEAISLAQMHEKRELEAEAQSWLGNLYRHLTKYDLSAKAFKRCLALTQSDSQIAMRAHALESLPEILMFTNGRVSEIEEYLQKSFVLYQQINDISGLARIYNKFGYLIVAQGEGNYRLALRHYQHCIELTHETHDEYLELIAIRNLVVLLTYLGDYSKANHYLQRGISIMKKSPNHHGTGNFYSNVAFMFLNMGQFEQFNSYQAKAFNHIKKAKTKTIECKTLSESGLFYYLCGQFDEAAEQFELSIHIAREINETRQLGTSLIRYGNCLIELNQISNAKEAFQEALEIQTRLGLLNRSMGALSGLAVAVVKEGDLGQAEMLAEKVFDHLQNNHLDQTDESLLIYMRIHHVFQMIDDARADEIEQLILEQLQQRAETLWNDTQKRAFWSAPFHAKIVTQFQLNKSLSKS